MHVQCGDEIRPRGAKKTKFKNNNGTAVGAAPASGVSEAAQYRQRCHPALRRHYQRPPTCFQPRGCQDAQRTCGSSSVNKRFGSEPDLRIEEIRRRRSQDQITNIFGKNTEHPHRLIMIQSQAPPSKLFYFGMIESKQTEPREHLKEFPGLGSPIIEEIGDFRLIEQKLLGYHDEDAEFEKFNAKLKEDCRIKNLSSESALSSEGSECEGSEGSLGITLRLRPTLPKKPPSMPRFSPAAAWRQLASLDAHLAAGQAAAAGVQQLSKAEEICLRSLGSCFGIKKLQVAPEPQMLSIRRRKRSD